MIYMIFSPSFSVKTAHLPIFAHVFTDIEEMALLIFRLVLLKNRQKNFQTCSALKVMV